MNLSAALRHALVEMERYRLAADRIDADIRAHFQAQAAAGKLALNADPVRVAKVWRGTDSAWNSAVRNYQFWSERARTLAAAIVALRTQRQEASL